MTTHNKTDKKKSEDRGIFQRTHKDGTVTFYIRLYHNGKPVVFGRFASKVAARKVYRKAKVEQEESRFDPREYQRRGPAPKKLQGALTFQEYAEQWIKDHRGAYKISTLRGYHWTLKSRWYPAIGTVPLPALTRDMIKEGLRDELDRRTEAGHELNPRTLWRTYNVIKRVLKSACLDEEISRNHAEDLHELLRKPFKFIVVPLSKEQERCFLAAVRQYAPQWYVLFFLLLRTGLRIGEALALQHDDIHFNDRFISVVRSWSQGRIQTTKTNKARRVDLARSLAAVLTQHIAQQQQEAQRRWRPAPLWLFPGQGKNPISQDFVRATVFRGILQSAMLPRFRIHDLRHTFATRLLLNGDRRGITLKYVSEQLGHTSIATTADIYAHLVPGGNIGAIDVLDDRDEAQESAASPLTDTPADTDQAA